MQLVSKIIKKRVRKIALVENKLSMDFIVNKYIDLEKRLALNEYKRNKDKKKIKRLTNDIYEEYETPQTPIDKVDKKTGGWMKVKEMPNPLPKE